jgi:transposase
MKASKAVEGEIIREIFETYVVEHFLALALGPGRLMVMDNLRVHKLKRVR